jgi:tetratricopeptide (TPR) repeat protein
LALGGDVVAAAARFEEALALDSTLWIEPEREARRLAVDALLFEGQRLARQGDIAGAVAQYSQALQLDPALRIDPQKAARGHALRASIEGLVEEASSEDNAGVDAQLQAALAQADPPPDLPADMWDNLCWYGALYGQAGRVADGACEVAIALADVDIFRRSRGLARARAGDVEGAIADLQVYMSSHEWDYELDEILERLENGEDPDAIFDAETLERLRSE